MKKSLRYNKFSDQTDIPPLATPKEKASQSSFPGMYPFTRGVQPTMYRGRLWTMRQYAGFGSAKQTNTRFKALLDAGQTGLSMAFDLPTQMGYDPDASLAKGEVGKVGVSIACLDDMRQVFHGISLADVSCSMTINATASILLCMYIAVAKEQGADISKIRGTLQNDILKEYVARGTYIFPPGPSMRLCIDIIEYCMNEVPKFNPISISGYHIREAGSDAVMELAFTLANACAYTQASVDRGLDIDAFAGRLSFFFASHPNFLEEIAKFRAARGLWADLAKHTFGAKKQRSMMMRFHTQTGGSTLTADQPDNNIVRTTLQAMSAILGGTQSLHTNGKDEALSLPTKESAMLALRTQQILAFESGIANTIDPFAGSYFMEELTETLSEKARTWMQDIAKHGGSVAAIEKGVMQEAISDRAYQHQQQIERGEKRIVGVNAFTSEEDDKPAPFPSNANLEQERLAQIATWRTQRNQSAVDKALTTLTQKAAGNENLVPFVLVAVEAGATLGEISQSLKEEFGPYQP